MATIAPVGGSIVHPADGSPVSQHTLDEHVSEHVSEHELGGGWVVDWNGVLLGAAAGVVATIVICLIGVAIGAHQVGQGRAFADWKTVGFVGLALSVFGAFLSFVIAGWVAGEIAGFRRAEPCMLHGACAWLIAVPLLVFFASNGGSAIAGGWLGALNAQHPAWQTASPVSGVSPASGTRPIGPASVEASTRADSTTVTPEQAGRLARNAALGTVAALLLGLMGAVVGGWLASGEPMHLAYYRQGDRVIA